MIYSVLLKFYLLLIKHYWPENTINTVRKKNCNLYLNEEKVTEKQKEMSIRAKRRMERRKIF